MPVIEFHGVEWSVPSCYALPGVAARERSKSRSFGNSVRTCSSNAFANSRVSQKRKTASNTRPGPRKSDLDHVGVSYALCLIFEAQGEFSGQPYALYELPRDLLPWYCGGHDCKEFQPKSTNILIHVDHVSDISRDPAHGVKLQVNPGPPGLIAGVVAIQHESLSLHGRSGRGRECWFAGASSCDLESLGPSRTWTCRS